MNTLSPGDSGSEDAMFLPVRLPSQNCGRSQPSLGGLYFDLHTHIYTHARAGGGGACTGFPILLKSSEVSTIRQTWVPIPASPFTDCVCLWASRLNSRSLTFLFFKLRIIRIYLPRLWGGLNEIVCLWQCLVLSKPSINVSCL